MDCRDFDEFVSLDLDGRLDPARKAELEKHVASCSACRAEADSARKAERILAALPRRSASAEFVPNLMQKAEALPAQSQSGRAVFLGLGRIASVAAGIAIGVALAGAFHFAVLRRGGPTSDENDAYRASKEPGIQESNLVRIARSTLGRNLRAIEAFNSDAQLFPAEEPGAASDVLEKEIRMLDIPGRIAEIRKFQDVYRGRNSYGWGFVEGAIKGTGEVVEDVQSLRDGSCKDDAVAGGIRLRAGESLRRIEAAREIFGPDFAPPQPITAEGEIPIRIPGPEPEDSGPVQLYVNGINLWAGGHADPAIKLFGEIEKAHAGTTLARRARDMTILILADKGRFKGDVQTLKTIEKLLGENVFVSQATMSRLARLLDSMQGAGGQAGDFGKSIKIRVMGWPGSGIGLFPTGAAQALAAVGSIGGLEANGRKIEVKKDDSARILGVLKRLPASWQVMSYGTSFGHDGRERKVSVVLVLPKGSSCAYPPDLAADLAALDGDYDGAFDSTKLERIAVEGVWN